MTILIDYNPAIIACAGAATKNFGNGATMADIRSYFMTFLVEYQKLFKTQFGDTYICCDSGENWRYSEFAYYKAKRKSAKAKSPINWDLVDEALGTMETELRENFPYYVLKVSQCEADDIIAVLANNLIKDEKMMIISRDKDFKQLQKNPNVRQWSPYNNDELKVADPDKFLKEHLIRGDSSDGIPNILSPDDCFVMGKRQKAVRATFVEECMESVGESFCTDDEMLERYRRNQKLIDFDLIPDEIVESIRHTYTRETEKAKTRSRIFDYVTKHRLSTIMDEIQYL